MTARMKINATDNGWNAAVEALEKCKTDEDKNQKIKVLIANVDEVQKKYKSSNAIFHYAEGVRDAIVEYETTGEIPTEA